MDSTSWMKELWPFLLYTIQAMALGSQTYDPAVKDIVFMLVL